VLANPCTLENSPDASEAEPWFKVPCIEVEPVIPNDPVIKADPVNGNGDEAGAYDADKA